eukprot:1672109-Pyramimonas_sp.AAC.1
MSAAMLYLMLHVLRCCVMLWYMMRFHHAAVDALASDAETARQERTRRPGVCESKSGESRVPPPSVIPA